MEKKLIVTDEEEMEFFNPEEVPSDVIKVSYSDFKEECQKIAMELYRLDIL